MIVLAASWGGLANAATFRWSSQGDFLTADPHAQNEGINNLIDFQIFERLVRRDKELKLVPSLATSWQTVNPTTWRFTLRRGVTFHDGTPLTADDVVFSIERAQRPTSNFKAFAGAMGKVRKVDDFTIELLTPGPTPVLLEYVSQVMIMSKAWAMKNGALEPQDYKSARETYASRHANGTGPYVLAPWDSDSKVTLRKNPKWWGIAEGLFEGNVDEMVYLPVRSDSTRMAALVSGEIDFVLDPPLQDVARLKGDARVRILEGLENRVVFLAMDQSGDALKYSDVKGRNPMRDLRVRQALFQAIDVEAIRAQVMRGQSQPSGSMVPAPGKAPPAHEPRPLPFDVARARKLLAEAGYPDGFALQLLCPNNRYVNDERICTAIAAMWAKVGVRASLSIIPRAQFFQRVDNFDFAVHLYGWGGAPSDPQLMLTPVIHSFDGKGKGDFNSGRFKDDELDRLIDAAAIEMDAAKRTVLIEQSLARLRDNLYTLPLHRQVIPWAMRKGVTIQHRADNYIELARVRVE